MKFKYLLLSLIFSGCSISMNVKTPSKIIINKCNIDNQLAPSWTCKEKIDYNEVVVSIPNTLLGQSFQEEELRIKAKKELKSKIEQQAKTVVNKINVLLKKKVSNKFIYLFSNQIINKIHYKEDWISKKGNMYLYALVEDKNYIANQFNSYLFKILKPYKLSPIKVYQVKLVVYSYLGGVCPKKPIIKEKKVKKITPKFNKHKQINQKHNKNKNIKDIKDKTPKLQPKQVNPKQVNQVNIVKRTDKKLFYNSKHKHKIVKETKNLKKKIEKKEIKTYTKKSANIQKQNKAKNTKTIKTNIQPSKLGKKENLPKIKKIPPVLKIKIEPKDNSLFIF